MYENYLVVYCLGGFILDFKGRILIVKKSEREAIDPELWVVPGGKVKKDENIIAALKREIKEEVGLSISNYRWVGEDVFKVDDKYFHAAHFVCKVKLTKKVILERSLTDYRWITKKEIRNYQFPANIKKEILNVFNNL